MRSREVTKRSFILTSNLNFGTTHRNFELKYNFATSHRKFTTCPMIWFGITVILLGRTHSHSKLYMHCSWQPRACMTYRCTCHTTIRWATRPARLSCAHMWRDRLHWGRRVAFSARRTLADATSSSVCRAIARYSPSAKWKSTEC